MQISAEEKSCESSLKLNKRVFICAPSPKPSPTWFAELPKACMVKS
jgi:hypothetical protein